ncbi:unnamed protein product [Leuciscus chuanchicus]
MSPLTHCWACASRGHTHTHTFGLVPRKLGLKLSHAAAHAKALRRGLACLQSSWHDTYTHSHRHPHHVLLIVPLYIYKSQRAIEEERASRHRDHSHHGSERYRESSGREEARDRHRERRHRERNEQHRSSRSSNSRRRHDSDDADSHRRHRHKRSRHNRGSLEPSEECIADQENQPEATE